jgi:hypothetical protein
MPPVPSEYEKFLREHKPLEGFTSGEPEYIELWSLDELADNNADIQIQEYAPGFIAFAGNGGGEVLAFNEAGEVFMLPLIGMAPDSAIQVAGSFAELAARFEPAS